MDHTQFKANQTAAAYVAEGLDEPTLTAFVMHMMGCNECLADVETWRAIKHNMPASTIRPTYAPAALGRTAHAMAGWRMAASLGAAAVLGAAGGWFGHRSQSPDLDSTQTTFFNVPAATRGAGDCTALRLAPDTKVVLLRVPGVARDRHVVAADGDKHELPAARYSSRLQPDGSYLVRIDAQALAGREVFLEANAADGFGEPLGCVAGEVSAGALARTLDKP